MFFHAVPRQAVIAKKNATSEIARTLSFRFITYPFSCTRAANQHTKDSWRLPVCGTVPPYLPYS
jgi:hypothetical protein